MAHAGNRHRLELTIREPRFYTDEEVALILREVAESADSPTPIRTSSSGFSLEQIKAAAAEAGLDSSRVERAALRIKRQETASFLERLAGGPRRHRQTIHLPTALDERTSARLLSALKAAAEVPGQGDADATGFSWYAWDRGNRLSVTAHEDPRGTRVSVLVDRSARMVLTLLASQFAIMMPIWINLEQPGVLLLAALPIGVLAAARAYWKASTRSVRERIAALLGAVEESSLAGRGTGGGQEPNAP